MRDSVLDDRVTINDATLGASGLLVITAPPSERHNGIAGSGFRLRPTADGSAITFASGFPTPHRVEFLEILGVRAAGSGPFYCVDMASTTAGTIDSCILHDTNTGGVGKTRGLRLAGGDHTARNLLVYDCEDAGIELTSGTHTIEQCTVRNNGTNGIWNRTANAQRVRNCAVFDHTSNFVAGAGGWDAASGWNATDSASAPGSSNQVSQSAVDQFLRLVQGDEHYFLRRPAACVDVGADLTGTVDSDIRGLVRPQGSVHDIGAFEYGPAAVGRLVGGALTA